MIYSLTWLETVAFLFLFEIEQFRFLKTWKAAKIESVAAAINVNTPNMTHITIIVSIFATIFFLNDTTRL